MDNATVDKSEIFTELEDLNIGTERPLELIVFVSFDLAGSTEFKQIKPDNWSVSVSEIFTKLSLKLSSKSTESSFEFKFWKFQGDELLLNISVSSIQEIVEITLAVDDVVRQTSLEIWQETNHSLDLKATVWCAVIDEKRNIRLPLATVFETLKVPQNVINDYVGTSIDEGFRVAHAFARAKRVTVSYDIALLLLSESPDNNMGFYHVGFDELKGIWNKKPYPAIWFTTQYDNDKEQTPYYTTIDCTLSQNFLEKKQVHHLPLLELLKNIYVNDAPTREHHDVVRKLLGLDSL